MRNKDPADYTYSDNCGIKLMPECDFSQGALPRQMTIVMYGPWEGGPVRSLVRSKEMHVSA